jgi:heat shock protein HslJ
LKLLRLSLGEDAGSLAIETSAIHFQRRVMMHSHKLAKLMAFIFFSGLLLTACGGTSTPAPAGSDLLGKTWLWQKTEFNSGKNIPVLQPAAYTLQFLADGKVNITADCNNGGGNYVVTNNVNLTIRVEALTRAICPPESLSDEYIKELNDTGSYTIQRNGELVLALKSGAGMRFKAQ